MDCVICNEDVIRTGYAVSVKCGHVFHGKCLLQWIETNKTCPVCRIEIKQDHITPLYLPISEMGRDESYRYTWEDTTSLNEKSNSPQVDAVVVVTPPTNEALQANSCGGLLFISGLILAFFISLTTVALYGFY